MSSTVEFSYQTPSQIRHTPTFNELVLSHHTDIEELTHVPCFFHGGIIDPFLTAKALLTISKVVKSSFAPAPIALRDPIVSVGKEQMRFEGFSSCNGVYARLDVLADAVAGEFIASGTTNVDFNEPMLNALNTVKKQDTLQLSLGSDGVTVETSGQTITEKKVKLPKRWLQGLTSVQVYLSQMREVLTLNKLQTIQLFNQLPKGKISLPMYISYIAGRIHISPTAKAGSIKVGGMERLRLLDGLLPLLTGMSLYQGDDGESMAVVVHMPNLRLTLALSPESHRGFSGEGQILEKLGDVPVEYVHLFSQILQTNETFDLTNVSFEQDLSFDAVEQMSGSLSAMGLLGFDVYAGEHYYRRLPFNMEQILTLNPRFANAQKLKENQGVTIISHTPIETHATVQGTDTTHTVVIRQGRPQCTCYWFAKHQDKRGLCKHILAVKMKTSQWFA